MTAFFEWVTAIVAFASGACWIKAARVRVTWAAMGTLNGPASIVINQIKEQSQWNTRAAWFAAAAAVAQGVVAVTRILSH
jgi:hypothetical protein